MTSLSAGRVRVEDLRTEFAECWRHYPRKVNKAQAFGAYVVTRRKGANPDDLLSATKNFAAAMAKHGREREWTERPHNFYGPDRSWIDYVDGDPDAE